MKRVLLSDAETWCVIDAKPGQRGGRILGFETPTKDEARRIREADERPRDVPHADGYRKADGSYCNPLDEAAALARWQARYPDR